MAADGREAILSCALLDLENIRGAAKNLQEQIRSRPDLLTEDMFEDIRRLRGEIINL